MSILLVCTGLLIFGNSAWADGVVAITIFSLVIGVDLHLISFPRHGWENWKSEQ